MTKFYQCPALIAAIDMYHHRGQEDSKEIGQDQYLQLVEPGENAQVGEQEKHHQSGNRQPEGRKQHAQEACCQNNLFIASSLCHYTHFLSRATGNPNCSRYLATVRRATG